MRMPIELVVAFLAAIACLISWPGLGIPVWAVFIGWAWYFAMGGKQEKFKEIYSAILPGAICSAIAIWIIFHLMSIGMILIPAMMIGAFVSVLLLMAVLRFLTPTVGFIAFNAYSTLFAVFYGGAFPKTGVFLHDLGWAFLFALIGNAVGPIFGYLSIVLSSLKEKQDTSKLTP